MRCVAIVDGYSTGRFLGERLRINGVRCIHVQSEPEPPAAFRKAFNPDHYDLDLGFRPDLGELARTLAGLAVERVVPGTEAGVLLADTLSALLGVPGNRPELAGASIDKALMGRYAARAGVAVPRGVAVATTREALAWYRSAGVPEVVVKPVRSGGSDNVSFCADEDSLTAACARVLTGVSVYGGANTEVLVQERVTGDEYYTNTVLHGGAHRTAEVWRYVKRPGPRGTQIYDYEEPVARSSPLWPVLRDSSYAVLDALGIRSGAAHTEIILAERGPVLVETGARLGGAAAPWIVERHSGVSQLGLFVDALLDPAALTAFDDAAVRWSAQVRMVDLHNHVAGTVRNLAWRAAIEALPTVAGLFAGVAPGTRLEPTYDLMTSPGCVYLASPDPGRIERDYLRLRAMEVGGLYTS